MDNEHSYPDTLLYNVYTFNRYPSGGAPNMTAGGLPASFPAINLPTSIPMPHGSDVGLAANEDVNGGGYTAHASEQSANSNGAVKSALVSQAEQPGLWNTVTSALFGGLVNTKTGTGTTVSTTSATGAVSSSANPITTIAK